MQLSPEVRKEVLQILQMLMHKDLPPPRPVEKKNSAPPPVKVQPVPEDFLTIRPDDPPGLKRLKRLASLDTTQLEHLPPTSSRIRRQRNNKSVLLGATTLHSKRF